MEILKEKILAFLQVNRNSDYNKGCGTGCNNGFGYGISNMRDNGDGDCWGFGYGRSSGNGYGDGEGGGHGICCCYGEGYFNGNGTGVTKYNGYDVYNIDYIPTIITNVVGNIAKGYTFKKNVILVPCYIAKVGNFFSHGDTIKHAYEDALAKYQIHKPIDERIDDFLKQYPYLDSVATHEELFRWHNILTGSCRFGRLEFCKEHNLDKEHGTMTVEQFINLTSDTYGGDVIRELKKKYI